MEDSDFSALTDIESDEYETTQSKKKKKKSSEAGYRIRNALRASRATTYTAQALYDQIHNGEVNLEPEYQRDVVWPETKQMGIIDSMFRNFYIPPVIFAVKSFEDGTESKTCIDGKQRLTSIHRFMDGLIPLKDSITGEKLWYKNVTTNGKNTKSRKLLPEKYRRLFANKQVVCVEYQDITESDEREIFQRVQLGMALTPAEKLQVISTPRASFIRELQASFLKEEGGLTGDALEWDRGRGSDFRCLANAVYCMEKYGPSLKNAGTVQQLEKWLSAEDSVDPSLRSAVTNTYSTFSDLVQDNKLNQAFRKPVKVSPVEFILISLLVYVHKDKLSPSQLAEAIGEMRTQVRIVHVDIRMNNRVAKTMLDFINDLKTSGSGVASSVPINGSAGESLKRKRAEEEDSPLAAKPKKTPSIASTEPISKPVDTQPTTSAISDRIAALRMQPPPPLPSSSNSSRVPPLPQRTSTSMSVSPNPNIANDRPLSALSPPIHFNFPNRVNQPPSQSNSFDTSLMGSMMRTSDPRLHPNADHPSVNGNHNYVKKSRYDEYGQGPSNEARRHGGDERNRYENSNGYHAHESEDRRNDSHRR